MSNMNTALSQVQHLPIALTNMSEDVDQEEEEEEVALGEDDEDVALGDEDEDIALGDEDEDGNDEADDAPGNGNGYSGQTSTTGPSQPLTGTHLSLDESMRASLANAWSMNTKKAYKTGWKYWCQFVAEFLQENSDPYELTEETPANIAKCVHYYCSPKNMKFAKNDGTLVSCKGRKYATAVKIRAAISHNFGTKYDNFGSNFEVRDEEARGNPTKSNVVRFFFAGLGKEKAKVGEQPLSVRSISYWDMKKVYQNFVQSNGAEVESMFYCMATFAFWGLFRVNELVDLKINYITACDDDRLTIVLPFRKTDQDGVGHTVVFHRRVANPEICPVAAFYRYYYLLRKAGHVSNNLFTGYAGNSILPNQQITTPSFMALMRSILKQSSVPHWNRYGSHSFRRGGVQFLNGAFDFGVKEICDYGGWIFSQDTNVITRYLVGVFDQPTWSSHDTTAPKRLQSSGLKKYITRV